MKYRKERKSCTQNNGEIKKEKKTEFALQIWVPMDLSFVTLTGSAAGPWEPPQPQGGALVHSMSGALCPAFSHQPDAWQGRAPKVWRMDGASKGLRLVLLVASPLECPCPGLLSLPPWIYPLQGNPGPTWGDLNRFPLGVVLVVCRSGAGISSPSQGRAGCWLYPLGS